MICLFLNQTFLVNYPIWFPLCSSDTFYNAYTTFSILPCWRSFAFLVDYLVYLWFVVVVVMHISLLKYRSIYMILNLIRPTKRDVIFFFRRRRCRRWLTRLVKLKEKCKIVVFMQQHLFHSVINSVVGLIEWNVRYVWNMLAVGTCGHRELDSLMWIRIFFFMCTFREVVFQNPKPISETLNLQEELPKYIQQGCPFSWGKNYLGA